MNNEITIDGVVYVKKEEETNTVVQKIPAQKLEWGKVCEKELNWKEAKKWCEGQGEDWRLPTIIELLQAYYGKVEGFGASFYWSSTEDSDTYARYVFFSDGYSNSYNKTYSHSVRCVRSLGVC